MKSKIFPIFILILFVSQSLYSQILEPISWEFKIDSSDFNSSGSIELNFIPTTELGWYIYSSDNDPESGPRTEFEFYPNKTYTREGLVTPLNVKTKFDEVWDSEVRYLDNQGSFVQKIEPLDNNISICLLYTSPSPRDKRQSRMPSSA